MNKKGLIGMILFFIVAGLIISIIIYIQVTEDKKHKEFCQNNGFETYKNAQFRWENSICIKIEDNYRVEKKYDRCGQRLCFVKNDAKEVGR